MAIDSQAKRASVLGIVQPDSTLDQGDRQTILLIYRGIEAGELTITYKTFSLPVEWGGTHTMFVVFGGTHSVEVEYGDSVSRHVVWED